MKIPTILRVYLTVYLILLVLLIASLVSYTDFSSRFYNDRSGSITLFSEDWQDPNGKRVDIESINVSRYGGKAEFSKRLPDKLGVNDELCFITNNSNVMILVDDKLSYDFHAQMNITGLGYGLAYHTVNIGHEDSGKMVRIILSSVFDTGKGGRIARICIGEAPIYRSYILRNRIVPFILSVFILISGVLIIILRMGIPKGQMPPYNLVALGVALTLSGVWLTGDTGVLQVIFGHIRFWRGIEYLLMLFAIPPTISFMLSFVKRQRGFFVHIAFLMPIAFILFLVFTRFVLGLGMNRFGGVLYVAYALGIVTMIWIIVDDIIFCRKNKIPYSLGSFYIGAGILILGTVIDIIQVAFTYGNSIINARGTYTRIGVSVLVIIMVIRITKWWAKEQSSIARDRFVNKILQYSMSSTDPDTKINLVMEYLGRELHADRAYIFEDVGNYKFDNTYEWCAKGVSSEIDNLKGLPYDGVVDVWYEEYKKNNVVLIYDIEEYKKVSENIYDVLKPQNINTLITTPLEVNGRYLGFFGVDNPPIDKMNDIREILRLLTYFISQLVIEKQYEQKLVYYSYIDMLTETGNRRAIAKFETDEFDPGKPYGYVLCDINGLKNLNDSEGHAAGDALIKAVADIMLGIFGKGHVFRMGGDEFSAYDCVSDRDTFIRRVEEVRSKVQETGGSISIGQVYCEDGDKEYEKVKIRADSLMYEEKRKFYEGKNNRRRE